VNSPHPHPKAHPQGQAFYVKKSGAMLRYTNVRQAEWVRFLENVTSGEVVEGGRVWKYCGSEEFDHLLVECIF